MMNKRVQTNQAPAAIGPYSQGMISGEFVFTAGQIPLHPTTGEMVTGDMKAQTKQVFENLKAVLREAGTDFSNAVKTTVYLTTMDDFPALNEIYGEYLGETKPARSTVAVAALPKGARVEVEVIARIP